MDMKAAEPSFYKDKLTTFLLNDHKKLVDIEADVIRLSKHVPLSKLLIQKFQSD